MGGAGGGGGALDPCRRRRHRVGIRLYVLVGAGNPPAADFAVESLTAARSADGLPVVRAAVRNTGGRALDLSGTLRLVAGPTGSPRRRPRAGDPEPVDASASLRSR